MKMQLFISLILIISFKAVQAQVFIGSCLIILQIYSADDIKEEIIDKIPYDTMQVSIGRSENTLIVLEEVIGESQMDVFKLSEDIYKNGFNTDYYQE